MTGPELPAEYLANRSAHELNPPFVPRLEHFPPAAQLEAEWQTLRDDALCLIRSSGHIPRFNEVDNAQSRIAGSGPPWRVFTLKAYGQWIDENLRLVPGTARVLRQYADEYISSAIFSILEPGKSVPEHCGPMKSVWRYHLGLVVPPTDPPFIQVEHFAYTWKPGEGVLFDDTFYHRVVNTQTAAWRVVLFLDVYRRDQPAYAQAVHRMGERLAVAAPSVQRSLNTSILRDTPACPARPSPSTRLPPVAVRPATS